MAVLFQQDLTNVEAGIYPLPADHDGSLLTLLHRSRLFFEDLPEIHRHRENSAHNEVLTGDIRGKRPRYYLQNFHFQTGGWLTDDSASRYDTQVEVLFQGTTNATRRQALPQLHEVFSGRDQRRLRLLDIGCGTGRFLDFLKQAWPRLPVLGLDMSEPYVRYPKRHPKRWSRINLTVGNAESLPVPDESQDAVTGIFLFHELPPKVRRTVFHECARHADTHPRASLRSARSSGPAKLLMRSIVAINKQTNSVRNGTSYHFRTVVGMTISLKPLPTQRQIGKTYSERSAAATAPCRTRPRSWH